MTTRTLALLLGASLAAFGCSGDGKDSGGSSDGGDADADADADSDTDADADADSDADVDDTNPFQLDVVANLDGTEIADACNGRTEASDDGTNITGTVYCSFAGGLGAFIAGEQAVAMVGTLDGAGGAAGSFNLVYPDPPVDLTFDWTGTYDETTVNGAAAGDETLSIEGVGDIPLTYSGSFSYQR